VIEPAESAVLVDRIRRGDADAEDRVARLFRGRVYTMMLSRTRDAETARDLVQETLLAVVVALREGRVREPERLGAFVHGIARNVVNNHFRTRRVEAPLDDVPPEASSVDPTSDYEGADRVALVRRILAGLDWTDRDVLLLTLVEGLKPGDIARRLGLSPEAVRTRKSRAIKKVADQIQGRHGT
jgi:RNA polymerase sigma-70 factor (ECF subfamily)